MPTVYQLPETSDASTPYREDELLEIAKETDEAQQTIMDSDRSGLNLVGRSTSDIASFQSLLDSITTIDPRLKLLWKQIYENALMDRRNAYMIWTDLYLEVHGRPEQHVIHGDHLSKYLERLEKSGTQLIRLAELVYKAKQKEDAEALPSGGALFDALDKLRR